jgi:hypothetical protein
MLSLLPQQQREASDPPAFVPIDVTSLLRVTDPWRRSQLAAEQVRHLEPHVTALLQIRRDAVGELIHKHQTPLSKVASHLGLTTSRISQLAQAALRALEGRDAR